MKIWIFVFGLLLQLPWLVLWAIAIGGSSQGSRGPGSMGLVLPAIVCATLWFAGGLVNAAMLVVEAVRARKASAGITRWVKVLGAATLAWLSATLYFALR